MKHSPAPIFGTLPLLIFALLLPGCEKAPDTLPAEPSKPETAKAPETGSVKVAKPETAKVPEPSGFEASLIQRFEGNQRDADAILERVQQSSEGEAEESTTETTDEGEGSDSASDTPKAAPVAK